MRPYRPEVQALDGRRSPSLVLVPAPVLPAPTPIVLAPAGFASGLAQDIGGPGGVPELLGD